MGSVEERRSCLCCWDGACTGSMDSHGARRLHPRALPPGAKPHPVRQLPGHEQESAPRHLQPRLMALMALMAHMVRVRGKRELSGKMREMTKKAFPESFCLELAQHLVKSWTGSIPWGKDDECTAIAVPPEFSNDGALVSWCAVPWGPITNKR